jgi:uncharacterized protein YjlB
MKKSFYYGLAVVSAGGAVGSKLTVPPPDAALVPVGVTVAVF